MDVELVAPPAVGAVLAALGRTEDVCFAPANNRVAIAGFNSNRVTLIDLALQETAAGPRIEATGSLVFSSDALKHPHGLDFLDDQTLVVTNRAGDLVVFRVPPGSGAGLTVELTPIQVWSSGGSGVLNWPGSVTVEQCEGTVRDILVCNNLGHTVTSHRLDLAADGAASRHEVRLGKWLDVPDGVTVSRDGEWIAVSSHNTHSVFVYRNDASLGAQSDPVAILRRVHYPHGLRFSADGGYLFVADAGAPYLNVYAKGDGWRGVISPLASVRIIDDERFAKGRHNPQEGGPKGIALDRTGTVLAVSSEYQPLEFFSVAALIEGAHHAEDQRGLDMRFEMAVMEEDRRVRTQSTELKASADYMRNSLSWKLTAPLRKLHGVFSSR